MANLDIKNLIENLGEEIDPDIEKEPSLKRFMERFLEEAFQPQNFNKMTRYNITSITIENFKCIDDAVTIPIRPITLLFGKNSSGKSTVLQALDYHHKIWQAQFYRIGTQLFGIEMSEFFGIEMSGGYTIDFGDFRSLVHRHELDREIRIRVEYASVLNDIDTDDTQNKIYQWREVVTGCKEEYPYNVGSLLFGFNMNGEELVRLSWKPEETSDDTIDGSNGERLIRLKQEEEDFLEDFPFEIYVNTNQAYKDSIDRFLVLFKHWSCEPQEFADGFGSNSSDFDIRHLGPFREVLQTSDTSWEKGLAAWDVLSRDPELVEKTNHYIQNVLNLGYSIDYQKHNSTDLGQWPRLHDENNDIDVRLSDIGVGIAQVIPVVVGALDDSHSPRIFAVEQPELHVHPAVQVALGDVFIDSIKSIKSSDYSTTDTETIDKFLSMMENNKEELLDRIKNIDNPPIDIGMIKDIDPLDVEVFLDGVIKDIDPLDVRFKDLFKIKEKYDHNVQVAIKELTQGFFLGKIKDIHRTMIIETHSEHLLLRLLRRVRETTEGEQTDHTLTPDNLSVVYVRPTPEGIKFTPISITDDGGFYAPWPEGFFAERVKELF